MLQLHRHVSRILPCRTRIFSTHVSEGLLAKVDIAIIGGGVIGCSTAYHLAKRDPTLKIVVFERDPTYKFASAPRSAGGIRVQFSTRENVLMSLYGMEFIRRLAFEIEDDDNDEVGTGETHSASDDRKSNAFQFYPGRYLILASTAEGEKTLKENLRAQRAAGVEGVRFLGKSELADRFPWMDVHDLRGGNLGPKEEGWFDPWLFLQGMKQAAKRRGVNFIHGEFLASQVSGRGDRVETVTVRLPGGSLQTIEVGQVVNAAGAWAHVAAERMGVHLPVVARKRCVFVVRYQGPEEIRDCPLLLDSSGVWLRPEGGSAGRTFLCGISPAEDPDQEVVQSCPSVLESSVEHSLFEDILWPALANRIPAFNSLKVTNSWAGYYDYHPLDQNAIIGRHPRITNLTFANGFSGHGLQQAPAAGRAVSELILHGKFESIDLSAFSYERTQTGEPIREKNVY